jgi:diguanylate cyclase (GGDEF)-like protein
VIDFVARWGGEEFVILLPNTDSEGAMHVAELVRSAVENTEIPSLDGGQAKKVTISIGVSTQIPTPEGVIADLITQADEALYRAKETGRNRVCRHENVG